MDEKIETNIELLKRRKELMDKLLEQNKIIEARKPGTIRAAQKMKKAIQQELSYVKFVIDLRFFNVVL